ncbi:MAG TPA: hypothetical protein VGC42_20395 [Kofleriaceae bacterium]
MAATSARLDLAGLTTRILGPADAKLTCVLMHGFGAPGEDLVSLAGAFAGAPVRFVFPAAPLELGGMYGDARAWWMIDPSRFERAAAGQPLDLRNDQPPGLADARGHIGRLLDELHTRLGVAPEQVVLGGFSQGAMLALDVALHRDTPPAGLVLMSGTLIASAVWTPLLPRLAGVPVMLSHGQSDGVLPFQVAEQLRDQLTAAGAVVDWQPFRGGHEIPMSVVQAVAKLLRARAA